ncbi:MAG: hypothetical protein IJP31_07675 [Lachnospiraceae bacterium]|nr:hypothetical protein [Lachnospiraceae bacterium]
MKELKAGKEVNMGKGLIETGVFLLILNILVAALLWEAVSHHWQIVGEGPMVDRAWIRQGHSLSFTELTWENGYLFLLHLLFGFLGNHQVVAVTANIFLQLFGLFLFYRGSRRLTSGVISLGIAGILAIVSIYGFSVVLDSPEHLMWFLGGFGIWLLSFIRPLLMAILSIRSKRKAVKAESKVMQKEAGEEIKPEMEAAKVRVEVKPEGEPEKAKPETETKPAIKLIPNPLPLPKKHVKKEMDYAFEPPKERMHYDLNNYNVNDDYDLKEG